MQKSEGKNEMFATYTVCLLDDRCRGAFCLLDDWCEGVYRMTGVRVFIG